MTCREKLLIDDPNCVSDIYDGGCCGCPHSHGYMEKPDYCSNGIDDIDCYRCWDREIPEEQEIVSKPQILDSGTRREFETGAVRDIQEGKGRCDLMPLDVVTTYLNNSVLGDIANFVMSGDTDYLFDCLHSFTAFEDDSSMLLEVSKHFEEGAKKYGEHNWRKGIPTNCYIDSAVRHYLKFLRGDKDEPHDRAFVWNILCCIWTCKHKPELNVYGREKES